MGSYSRTSPQFLLTSSQTMSKAHSSNASKIERTRVTEVSCTKTLSSKTSSHSTILRVKVSSQKSNAEKPLRRWPTQNSTIKRHKSSHYQRKLSYLDLLRHVMTPLASNHLEIHIGSLSDF